MTWDHICRQGADNRKLGRWSFITIDGKNRVKTTFVTAYCPVISNSPGSCYSQQLLYMAEHLDEVPPGMMTQNTQVFVGRFSTYRYWQLNK